MNLILTSYLRTDPDRVDDSIEKSVEAAVDAAAARIGAAAPVASTDHVTHGIQLHTDVGPLDGTTVEWSGTDQLTELRVVVPWRRGGDSREHSTLAASRFASVLTGKLAAA